MTSPIKLSIVMAVQHAQSNLPEIVRALRPATHPEVEFSKKGLHEFAGCTSEYVRRLSGQGREFLSSIETSASSPRKIDREKRPPRHRTHAGTNLHSAAEARFD